MPHQARKRFGQHFLHDQHVINRIVDIIAPDEKTPIVEIGPGQGALTKPLLSMAGKLDVIEIDTDLVQLLNQNCQDIGILNIHTADVLSFDLSKISTDKIKLVGNLPYNISTPFLFHVLEQTAQIERMVFMMQKEVVDRICATPGNKAYGRLSVMVQSHCEVEKVMNIGPGAFTPPPKVDSSIVSLRPLRNNKLKILNQKHFIAIVKQAFSQRRKTIRNSLKAHYSVEDFQSVQIDPGCRAENLTLNDYIQLANLQHK